MAIRHVLEHGGLSIQDYEALCPNTNRRTLQRDPKGLMDKGLLAIEDATNRLTYRLKEARQ